MARILVVEDDRDMAHVLLRNLEAEGHSVGLAFDGASGLAQAQRDRPDLIILDLMLPNLSGFVVLEGIRLHRLETPVLLLTARSAEDDKVRAFSLGADDYVTKPFGMRELAARVAALLRRTGRGSASDGTTRTTTDVVKRGPLEVTPEVRGVVCRGAPISLTPKGYDLLLALLAREGVVTRHALMREVWRYDADVESRTLDTHIGELRRKLERDPSAPELIHTVWKVGYRLLYEPCGTRE